MFSDDSFRERRSSQSEEDAFVEEALAEAEAEDKKAQATGNDGAPDEESPASEGPQGIDLERLAEVDVPEASFLELIQPLEIQALQFLGEMPITREGEKRVLPRWAKHVIDLLGILEERTRGNLTDEEALYLERVLTDLRARFVKVVA